MQVAGSVRLACQRLLRRVKTDHSRKYQDVDTDAGKADDSEFDRVVHTPGKHSIRDDCGEGKQVYKDGRYHYLQEASDHLAGGRRFASRVNHFNLVAVFLRLRVMPGFLFGQERLLPSFLLQLLRCCR